MAENEFTTIGAVKMCRVIFVTIFYGALQCFYTVACTKIPKTKLSEALSVAFIVYTIIGWIQIIRRCVNLHYYCVHYREVINVRRFNLSHPNNRCPLAILKLFNIINLAFMTYIMVFFSPVKASNCDIYNDAPFVCLAMQIVTVFGYIYWPILVIITVHRRCCYQCSFSHRISDEKLHDTENSDANSDANLDVKLDANIHINSHDDSHDDSQNNSRVILHTNYNNCSTCRAEVTNTLTDITIT